MTLRLKIPAIIALASLLATFVSGVIGYFIATDALQARGADSLAAVLQARAAETRRYFDFVAQDLTLLAGQTFVADAVDELNRGWEDFGDQATDRLQKAYVEDNPHPDGQKQKLEYAPNDELYDYAHARYHPSFYLFQAERGYADLFLINNNGDLIYSVVKGRDFATNLNDGPWRGTDLANAFRDAQARAEADAGGGVAFFDFRAYPPAADAPVSFVAMPIRGRYGTVDGVIAVQLPAGAISAVIGGADGLGRTGEAVAVGPDKLMRSHARFGTEDDVLRVKRDTPEVRAALDGRSGVAIAETRIVAYQPLDVFGVRWALEARVDLEEVNAGAATLRDSMLLAGGGLLVVLIAVGVGVSRTIVKPMRSLTTEVEAIAEGRLDAVVEAQDRKDEVGAIARAVEVLRRSASETETLRAARDADARKAADERRAAQTALADRFEQAIGGVAADLVAAADQLRGQAQALSGAVGRTRNETAGAATASENSAANASSAATATEELSSSSLEIARQVQEGADISRQAVAQADQTNAAVGGLADSASKIGEVVKLISDIAEQTNLLALNATIEAARAGDAGKGFAVVASEVKGLATQTAQATDEIGRQIADMQNATGGVVGALEGIGGIIGRIDGLSAGIAAAVEEQSAATSEIAKSAQLAASGAGDVSAAMGRVAEAADTASSASGELSSAADGIAGHADRLRSEMRHFLESVRA